MQFQHASQLWAAFPQLVPAAVVVSGLTASADVGSPVQQFTRRAAERLADRSEAELPEIQAWRRAFSQMGLKPTQYRCASEALLRRFRKEGQLPSVHPLVDLCNALSIAYATPIAAFDLAHVDSHLEVRHADGTECYQTFGGDIEHPEPGEVIFCDAGLQAHARRWTNRQSGLSAVKATTTSALIVSEALHDSADEDQAQLLNDLTTAIGQTFHPVQTAAILTIESPALAW